MSTKLKSHNRIRVQKGGIFLALVVTALIGTIFAHGILPPRLRVDAQRGRFRDPQRAASLIPSMSLAQAPASFIGTGANGNSGTSVAGAGDVNGDGYDDILIGAPSDGEGGAQAGKVCLIFGSESLHSNMSLASASVTFIGENPGDYAGISVAGVGDVNGDGYDDILIGAYGHAEGTFTNNGKIYVIFGNSSMHGTIDLSAANASFFGEATDDKAGRAVAGAGDVNGDGMADFLIGACLKPAGLSGNGKTYLIYGNNTLSGSKNLALANASFVGEFANDNSGISVAGAGDVNGDGKDDILIGAWGYSQGASNAGKTYLIYGNGSLNANMGLGAANASFIGEIANSRSGFAVAGSGDINGDGKDDILIGAYRYNSDLGKVYLIYGNGSLNANMGLGAANISFLGIEAGAQMGAALCGPGDVNGDGMNDILISARFGSSGNGVSYLVYGNHSLNPSMGLGAANASFIGAIDDNSGFSVAGAGDVNKDGFADLLIGAPLNNEGETIAGKTYLIFGPDSFPPAPVMDLTVANPISTSLLLTWTAPGDDGNNGNVSGYLLKYSIYPITDDNFGGTGIPSTLGWTPLVSNGSQASCVVTGLSPSTTYYFAIKAYDDVFQYASISNVASGATTASYDWIWWTVGIGATCVVLMLFWRKRKQQKLRTGTQSNPASKE